MNCQKEEILQSVNSEEYTSPQLRSGGDYKAYLEHYISMIAEMVDQGVRNKGNGNALISKLEASIKSLDKGNNNAANNQLRDFINQVEEFVQNGTLTLEQANELINGAKQAIDGDYTLWAPGLPFSDERDGNVYETVVIGDQCWMAENLAYLPDVSPVSEGSEDDLAEANPYYYVYNNLGNAPAKAKTSEYFIANGALYNWEAAKTACPSDWHLPSDSVWTVLTDFLGSAAGAQMKEAGGTQWLLDVDHLPNNLSEFTALPAGCRTPQGYGGLTAYSDFWSIIGLVITVFCHNFLIPTNKPPT